MIPAVTISAMASMIPEPHTPVTLVPPPITPICGSNVSGSMRTRSMAPAVARWPQLIWAPSNAGPVGLDAANTPGAVAEHDLGVRPDVDEQLHRLAAVRTLGEDRRGGVGADVAGDARPGVGEGVGQVEVEVGGAAGDGLVGGQHERRLAERRRVDAEHDVVHDRVADEHDLEHEVAPAPCRLDQLAGELVDRPPHDGRQLTLAAGVHHHVRHPAHQVLAEADLRVHPPGRRQHLARAEVAQVAGDRRRPDVDGDAVGGVDVARPHGDDR